MEKGNKRTYVNGDIDLSGFKMKDELNPKVWDGEKMKPEVRKALLKIADDYFEGLDLGSEVDIEDISMTGSLANYNWSEYSDVDLHILTEYAPALIEMVVPGDSSPSKLLLDGFVAVTSIVHWSAVAVPPLSLITCLITVRVGVSSSFVIVQVADSPSASVPEQLAPIVLVYPDGPPDSSTEYVPASTVMVVPGDSSPSKLLLDGFVAVTSIVHWSAVAVPPL